MIELPKMIVPRKRPENVYIRFGRWSSRSTNWCTREEEKGVSVYPAKFEDGYVTMLSYDDKDAKAQLRGSGRLVFVLTGKVVGTGSDGEPLLTRIKALAYAIDIRVGEYLKEIGRKDN